MFASHFNTNWLNTLLNSPNRRIESSYNGVSYLAKIIIPDYRRIVEEHYNDIVGTNIENYCKKAEISVIHDHYGLSIEFVKPMQVELHNREMRLDPGAKQILERLGPILIKNAYFPACYREVNQRNRFPHLNFHIDRHISHDNRFSLYTRDPFDAEQKHPRKSSTLFVASIVGYLQAVREGMIDPDQVKGINQSFEVFKNIDLSPYIGQLIIEQKWDSPEGTGEMSMLDNATELHSSYERQYGIKGYRIGVRYLS